MGMLGSTLQITSVLEPEEKPRWIPQGYPLATGVATVAAFAAIVLPTTRFRSPESEKN
jgi:hypothetical protein